MKLFHQMQQQREWNLREGVTVIAVKQITETCQRDSPASGLALNAAWVLCKGNKRVTKHREGGSARINIEWGTDIFKKLVLLMPTSFTDAWMSRSQCTFSHAAYCSRHSQSAAFYLLSQSRCEQRTGLLQPCDEAHAQLCFQACMVRKVSVVMSSDLMGAINLQSFVVLLPKRSKGLEIT